MGRPSTDRADRAGHNAWRRWGASAVLLVPFIELLMHLNVQRRVVQPSDWSAAAAHVRAQFRAGDLVMAAPSWADPIVRWQLGDLLTLGAAGRGDHSDYDRVWMLRAHQAPPSSEMNRWHTLTWQRQMGPVQVQRWDRKASASGERVLYDFVERIAQARVYLGNPNKLGQQDELSKRRACNWHTGSTGSGGGLSAGPYIPADRFVCDEQRGWLWVGATVLEDLQLQPRWCVWQHPAQEQDGPVVAEFDDVPLGRSLVLHAGLYYEHERAVERGPVTVEVWVDDRKLGQLVHRDGDGWARRELSTVDAASGGGARHARVQVRVHAPDPHLRTLCWAMKAVQ